jgi:hypothetical protein
MVEEGAVTQGSDGEGAGSTHKGEDDEVNNKTSGRSSTRLVGMYVYPQQDNEKGSEKGSDEGDSDKDEERLIPVETKAVDTWVSSSRLRSRTSIRTEVNGSSGGGEGLLAATSESCILDGFL